tara:strand:+ start:214 stop:384 length:171 start_codon:yes stop_codon:yes gene_type:complete
MIIAVLFAMKPFFEMSISIPKKIMDGNTLKLELNLRVSAMLLKIAEIEESLDWLSR